VKPSDPAVMSCLRKRNSTVAFLQRSSRDLPAADAHNVKGDKKVEHVRQPRIYVGPASLSDLNRALQLEWLVTNGLGGYASSTVLGVNTRKYHGLLVSACNPPVNRHVSLSKLDEEVEIDANRYVFSANEFRDTIFPDGYRNLESFVLDPLPTFNYHASGFYLKKTVFMPHLRDMTIIEYEAVNSRDASAVLRVYPLVNMRHFHHTTDSQAGQLKFIEQPVQNGVTLKNPSLQKSLTLLCTEGIYMSGRSVWIKNVYFRVDAARGENCVDDEYQLGFFEVTVPSEATKRFYVAAIGGRAEEEPLPRQALTFDAAVARKLYEEETVRRERLLKDFSQSNPAANLDSWIKWLITAADCFVVERRSTGAKSVIAGYHWFEDWGRDTLISLPGLTLVTGRFRDAEEVLLTFKQYCKNGLIPNRFPDRAGDEPVYDSVDATLWFFNAVFQYLKYTGRFDFVRTELWETLQDMIEHHIHGTMFDIHMDEDYLLSHGSRLTWMDVSIDGKPVTPRTGKAVEIQALWYNALRIMQVLALRFGRTEDAERYGLIADRARDSFNRRFWWAEGNYLFDSVNGGVVDSSLRPNQIIAVSLDFCMLDDVKKQKVFESVWRELWGTYGLRTLSSRDPRYVGKYEGGIPERDRAYHNGTVWAWLLGPFVTAFLNVKGHSSQWRRFAFERFLRPLFLEQIRMAGLGSLSEIFDGDHPHCPRGCISQAWSVAEPLRVYIEDIIFKRPPYEKDLKA